MTPKELLKAALSNYRGDNLERARAAFRNYTFNQMTEQYGASGETPASLLAKYEKHVAACEEAGRWLEAAK